jgi:nitroimidazol reductase NimA-like FMN-containing flavoprotein (pyridoxamine 5'-phosphate oxidase superfamily)
MTPALVTVVKELSREECLELLQYNSYVGRLGFIADGRPMILPVNYLAEETFLVFCTTPGTKLSSAAGAPVAFEVDGVRTLYRSGWSVLVQGVAHAVTDPEEIERLRRGPLTSWANPGPQQWIRVSIDEISGRRIPG